MWTKLKNFINSMCLILAPYINICKFGGPPQKSNVAEKREDRCSKLR
ncbi:hypothetical protein [Pyrobaculum islandicum]|nr:hypothetical protein [Pyrobaculum islandicum]